jgi:hypothetical protein
VPAAAGSRRPFSAIRPPGRRVPLQRAVSRGRSVSRTGAEAAGPAWATRSPGTTAFARSRKVPSGRVVPAASSRGAPPGGWTVTETGWAAGGVTVPVSRTGFP